ncbi:uncharacterized protein N7443_007543 [Penicillium atrosanguineum]|uniref:uncharacterized protein n=1 Tax=Penicillium atrosanguineum TaxID=1132637 RepID=UPI0023A0BC74|nr:uncharacterized protein N7443_007543 [Penicillium atrosanguineum]KAJ5296650.1 hypothetical protein N7443_007543 [Penicillium atrosanguineum]
MTKQPFVTHVGTQYARRGDRMQEEPSAKNAQGLFSPDACIFIGNLSTKVPAEQLAEDLKRVFLQFGPCHVKIKQDKKRNLPGAFVQFERVEDANAALECDQSTELHGRYLRVEKAKGRRTALLGFRSGAPISEQEVLSVLGGRGVLEAWTTESHQSGNWFSNVGKVTFAYVDDCKDAIRHFSKDHTYYLSLLDMDGSPLKPGSGPTSEPPQTKPYNLHQSFRGNHPQRGFNGRGGHRNGPPRGGYRGYSRYRNSQYHQENMHPRAWSTKYHTVITHPFYPHPPPNNGFASPPFIIHGQPMYGNPFSSGLSTPHPPPGTFPPKGNNGPFIVGGQPMYSPHPPACWGEPHQQSNGYYSPSFHMPNYSEGYFSPDLGYSEPHPQDVNLLTVPHNNNKVTPPSTIVTVKEDDRSCTSAETATEDETDKKPREKESFEPEGDTEIESEKKTGNKAETKPETRTKPEEDIFSLKDRERPRLIRVHDSDTEDEGSDDDKDTSSSDPETKSEPKSMAKVAEEVDEDYTTPEPTSESDTTPETTPDKKEEKASRTDNMPNESYVLRDCVSSSSPQTCIRRPVDEEYQLRTGKTIGEYIRKGVEGLQGDYPKELMEVVAREIAAEEQEKEKTRKESQEQELESKGGLVV